MSATSESRTLRRAEILLRTGAVLTIIGIGATLIAMLPLVTDIELPSIWWFFSMITGVGLAIVIAGLIVSARSRRNSGRG